jgi:anti-sigma B factor antagonist/stage II sporulation protein AA (anti-sigma F factor antagonist)
MVVKVSVDQPKANITRIALEGRLDVAGTQAAETEFNAAVASSLNVIVDLSKVAFVSSVGIRMLVAGAQDRSKAGGKMVLAQPDELTKRILHTTGIEQIVPVYGGLDEALACF